MSEYNDEMFIAPLVWFVCSQKDSFPDNGKNHWAYEGVSYLKSTGVLIGYPDGLGYQPLNRSRYEFAIAYWAASSHLASLSAGLQKEIDEIATSKSGPNEIADFNLMRKEFLSNPLLTRAIDYLARARVEFASEIKSCGGDPPTMDRTIATFRPILERYRFPLTGSALQQFPDVPSNSWAASAVWNLRVKGILRGYPDGKFNG
jgi:hypothetical protein